MIKRISLIGILTSFLLFTACSTVEPRVYNGDNPKPQTISVLYKVSNSVGIINNPKDAGISVTKVIDSNGKIISPSGSGSENLGYRYELIPGKYTLIANWSRTIGYKDHPILENGDTLEEYLNGFRFLNSPIDKYKITFVAKAGMTYVFDIRSTMKFLLKSPDRLCLTEELHNAKGALGAKYNENVRYPSIRAKIIACSK